MGRMKQNIIQAQEQEQTQAPAQPDRNRFAEILKKQWGKIEAVAPKHLSTERLFNMTVSAVNHNPKLLECRIETLLSCVMRCSALGIEPSDVDGLGRAYILPFYNSKKRHMEATFILGYRGMIELARRSNQIKDIVARAVYEGDEFEYVFGFHEDLRHVPKATQKDPTKLTHVYLIANFTNGGHYIGVMSKDELEKVRKRSQSPNKGPWVTDYEAMCLKSITRRDWKWLPLSVETQAVVTYDETTGGYEQALHIDMPVFEVPEEKELEPAPEVEPEVVEAVASDEKAVSGLANTGSAVCRSCGCVVPDVAPDATLQDLNKFLCCEKPDYQWQ